MVVTITRFYRAPGGYGWPRQTVNLNLLWRHCWFESSGAHHRKVWFNYTFWSHNHRKVWLDRHGPVAEWHMQRSQKASSSDIWVRVPAGLPNFFLL